MATTQNTSYFSELGKIEDTSRYFDQGSVDSGTLGQEYAKVELAVDENLTAFDTSPVLTSEKPSTTKTEEKASEADEPTSIKKKLGANWDVLNDKKLGNITFVTGCEMSDAIAYIRYWSRSGVTPKTTVTPEQAFTLPSDVLKKLGDELGDMYRLPEDFNTSYSLPENFNYSDYFNYAAESNKTTLTVPENTAYQSRPRQPVPARQSSSPRLDFKAGNVFSANPSGIVQGSTSAAPSDAVWHFLFNPEELQLSSGPEYNKAETWGVSDPANSGQPLSWRNNRNRKLTFNKVLLHGYSFGKRVDSLEKGLQDLFMAREGEGSDGPPVLEFVWGKRHFGPCVIQNIQVREKAWDKGLLVNAEVSFDLEQVPEWTINDGFVDVLRPGRQPLINDPVLPPSTQAADDSGDTEVEEKDVPGGGGGRSKNLSLTLKNCQAIYSDSKAWNDLIYTISATNDGIDNYKTTTAGGGVASLVSIKDSFPDNYSKYLRLKQKAEFNSFYKNSVKTLPVNCQDPTPLRFSYESSKPTSNDEKRRLNSSLNDSLLKCSNSIKSIIVKFLKQYKCDNYTLDPRKQGPRLF